jgi:hypothetical protein
LTTHFTDQPWKMCHALAESQMRWTWSENMLLPFTVIDSTTNRLDWSNRSFGYWSASTFAPCNIDSTLSRLLTWQPQSYWFNHTLLLTDLANIFQCGINLVKLLNQPREVIEKTKLFLRSTYWADLIFAHVTLLNPPHFWTAWLLKQPHFSACHVIELTLVFRYVGYSTNLTF